MVGVDSGHRLGGEQPGQGVVQPAPCHTFEQVRRQAQEPLLQSGSAGHGQIGPVHQPGKGQRCVFERLAFEQAGQEKVAFLPQRQLLLPFARGAGQEAPRFELEQDGRRQ